MWKLVNRILKNPYLGMLICCAIGILIRLDYLLDSSVSIDADEAIVGLMGKHILEGAEVPIFYYGQNYMGSLEAILVSYSFKLFGISNFSLKLVPFIFSILLIPLVYILGIKLGGNIVGFFAGLLTATPPYTLILWSSKARGGFIELIFLGMVSYLFLFYFLNSKRENLKITFATGLILGFGWWVNNQIIYYIAPIGLCYLANALFVQKNNKLTYTLKHLSTGLFSFFLGGSAFWIYNLKNEFISFQMLESAKEGKFIEHLSGFFSTALPIILGARRFWEEKNIFPFADLFVYVLYAAIFLLFTLLMLKNKHLKLHLFSLLMFVLGSVLIFSMSKFGNLVKAPRYLLPLYPVIFLITAYVLKNVYNFNKTLSFSIFGALLAINLTSSYYPKRAIAGEPIVYRFDRVQPNHNELIDFLRENNYKMVRTNYWIGYKLAFETNEEILFSVFQKPTQRRIKSYENKAKTLGKETLPFVLTPAQTPLVEIGLKTQGFQYRKTKVSNYIVIDNIEKKFGKTKKINSSNIEVTSNFKNSSAINAIDGDRSTRWGSGTAQKPGMIFKAEFSTPTKLAGFKYDIGKFYPDKPRKLKIEIEDASGNIKTIFTQADYNKMNYLIESSYSFSFFFKPQLANSITFTQLGSDPMFDWSIAELELYEAH